MNGPMCQWAKNGPFRRDGNQGLNIVLLQSVDISFAPLAVSSMREEVIDFAFPFYLEYTAVMYAHSDMAENQIIFYIDPLHWIVSW